MRRRRVHEAGERGAAAGTGAAAMQDSPRLAAQRRQLEQSFGAPVQAVAQRVKDKPDNEVLAKALASCVSSTMGACCKEAAAAYKVLAGFVDSSADLAAVLLTWSENAHSDLDIGNHTACTATWSEGTFVVDTTAAQFGGPEIFIGSVSAWQEMILSHQTGEVGNVSCRALDKPATDGEMISDVLDLKYRLSPKKPKVLVPTQPPDDKKPGKGGGKGSGEKKTKCYLTSACVAYRGLPDDCHELTVLRAFRDGWLAAQPQGPALIEQYYAVAPDIVDAIEASGVARAVYARVFSVVRNCVECIESHRPPRAMQAYRALVETLQALLLETQPKEAFHGH
jgi:hypothetical protein